MRYNLNRRRTQSDSGKDFVFSPIKPFLKYDLNSSDSFYFLKRKPVVHIYELAWLTFKICQVDDLATKS